MPLVFCCASTHFFVSDQSAIFLKSKFQAIEGCNAMAGSFQVPPNRLSSHVLPHYVAAKTNAIYAQQQGPLDSGRVINSSIYICAKS